MSANTAWSIRRRRINPGATGVGERVTMRDADGKALLDLIVGKEVPEKPDLRYVRKADESEIYIVAAKTDKLSTKFEDWIEPNLLKINTIDLREVLIHDYAVQMDIGGLGIVERDKMQIAYNDAGDPHWKMLEDKQFVADNKKEAGGQVGAGEDDRQRRTQHDEARRLEDGAGRPENRRRQPQARRLERRSEGDGRLRLERRRRAVVGEEGLLRGPRRRRPGGIVLERGRDSPDDEGRRRVRPAFRPDRRQRPRRQRQKGKSGDKAKNQSTGLNRYLLVMADSIPTPSRSRNLRQLPEPAKAKEAGEEIRTRSRPRTRRPTKKPDEKKPAADTKALEAERARIEKENKRKQEEYDQQIADGKKKVDDLNARFADWYYVISDEVYRKIHLGRDEIVMKKPKKEPEKGRERGPECRPLRSKVSKS